MSSDLEQAEEWARRYLNPLVEGTEQYVAWRMKVRPEERELLGEPTVGMYSPFDIAAVTPIQFIGSPPHAPSKIVVAGEPAFIVCFLFVNSLVDIGQGFAIPPSVQLGRRQWRVRLEQINLSDLATIPAQTLTGVFAEPAPMFTIAIFRIPTPDPGQDARLMEANITADIAGQARSYAAFATALSDLSPDAWDLGLGPPLISKDTRPIRYLIYPK